MGTCFWEQFNSPVYFDLFLDNASKFGQKIVIVELLIIILIYFSNCVIE